MSLQTSTPIRQDRIPAARAWGVRAAQVVVEDLFGPVPVRPFAVRYWDGTLESPGTEVAFTLLIRRPGSLRRLLLPPSELALVEAFLHDDVDVEGDLEASAELGDLVARRIASRRDLWRLVRRVLALPYDRRPRGQREHKAEGLLGVGRIHSRRRDRAAVQFHYDVGNDFYSLWLDRQMVYSCAYFARGDEDLDAAQTAKLDYVCRKLRLRPGERFLDIGCGWGALLIHAAQHYNVHAFGITLSERQASFARARAAAAGLGDRVEIEVRDYRELNPYIRFDKIASVGMVEHVGMERLDDYFAAAYRVLEPGGLFLNHGIVAIADARPRAWHSPITDVLWRRHAFITKYVFPDGRLVPAAAMLGRAERVGFELRDVESLRDHYVTTLRHWVRRLEAQEGEAVGLVGQVIYRVWRLYMAASAHGFRTGRIGVIQSLLGKPDAEGAVELPRTRADLYR